MELGEGRVTLSLADAALLAPVLDYASSRLRRDGQRLSVAQQLVVARITTAEADYRRLGQLVTTAEAARLLGVKVRRVVALIQGCKLDAVRVDGRWLIERASVMNRIADQKAASTATAPPAAERPPRIPGVPNRHRIPWADPTANAALERSS